MKTLRLNKSAGSYRRQGWCVAGFTLIEMLVVLLIIGIIMSMVTLSIRSDDRAEKMEEEMQRIQALLKMAREEAVMQDEDIALRVSDNSYAFEVLGEKGWQPISDDKIFTRSAKSLRAPNWH